MLEDRIDGRTQMSGDIGFAANDDLLYEFRGHIQGHAIEPPQQSGEQRRAKYLRCS